MSKKKDISQVNDFEFMTLFSARQWKIVSFKVIIDSQ